MGIVADEQRPWVGWVLWLIGGLLLIATLLPIIVTNRSWIRLFTFPQVQFAFALCIVALASLFLLDLSKGASKLLLAVLVAAIIYQASYLLPYTPLWPKQVADARACPAENRLRVLVLNVLRDNRQTEAVLNLVRNIDPDLFLALETDPHWARALRPLAASHPNVVDAVRSNHWGMILFSRLPLVDPEVRYFVHGYVPSIRTGVQLGSGAQPLFYGLHPKPPFGDDVNQGDTEVIRAGREIGRSAAAAVLAGDLNDVPWSRTTGIFHELAGTLDPRVGRGLYPTFKTDAPLMSWPLDHIFATSAFRIADFERLPDVGSDHYPILATLCYRAAVDAPALETVPEERR